jgi:uncharacterized oxidoreductase
MPTLTADSLRAMVRDIVAAAGSRDEEPALVADNLVYANLTGHDSHGVGMLPRYVASIATGELRPNEHAEIVSDRDNMLVVDGHAGYGQVIGREAMGIGIERTRRHGVCVLAVRNSFHLCRIGAWAELCAEVGLVSMHHVNAVGHRGIVTPYRGTDARYTTNPYCCAIPATDTNPMFVLDMATSVIAHGKIRIARNKGERLPDDVLLDGHGQPTDDPNDLFGTPGGAIRSFAKHKGYGLALVNELLAGVLSGGRTCRPETDRPNDAILNNMLSVIIDPTRLVDEAFSHAEIDATYAHVKASPPEREDEPVLVPGDPERIALEARSRDGIPVDAETWRELLRAGVSVGLDEGALAAHAG